MSVANSFCRRDWKRTGGFSLGNCQNRRCWHCSLCYFLCKKVTIGSSKEQFTLGEYRFEKVNGGVYQKWKLQCFPCVKCVLCMNFSKRNSFWVNVWDWVERYSVDVRYEDERGCILCMCYSVVLYPTQLVILLCYIPHIHTHLVCVNYYPDCKEG